MIDFLSEAGISKETIHRIEQENDNEIYSLSCNKKECLRIINYLTSIGIKNIDELLIYEIEMFYKMYVDIVDIFSKYDLNKLVNAINNDYRIIESNSI